jgi:sulfite oxidase
MPVQSLITSPSPGDIISAAKNGLKSVKVKGIAWGGGGSGINRVDVSLDDGKTFTRAAVLDNPIEQARRSQWAWKFFEKEIPIPDEMRWKLRDGQQVEMVLTSKALNASWNMQPEHQNPNVNAHGCCVNHWYRVPVTLCPRAPDHIKAPDGDFGNKPSGGRFATAFRNLDQPHDAAKRLAKEKSQAQLCTCGLSCKPGHGCLATRFSSSPSKLYERKQREQVKQS